MRARKRFGQHFLVDEAVLDTIINIIAPVASDYIVEIGPGHGALTERLLRGGAAVHAIEIDRDLVHVLHTRYKAHERFAIYQADVLEFDFARLAIANAKIVGNLPYNISTPIFFTLMRLPIQPLELCFMVQREVAERLMASPGTHNFGRLSVMLQAHYQISLGCHVPPSAFSPPPKVESSVITLRYAPMREVPFKRLETIVAAAFLHRRKMLRHTLGRLFSKSILAELGIDETLRPENLEVAQYLALAEVPLEDESLDPNRSGLAAEP